MIRTAALLLALSLCCHAKKPPPPPKEKVSVIKLQLGPNGPVIAQEGDSRSHTRPYVHPLRSPDGKHVLTQFSPNHHRHQTGLYWGQTRINGRDYFHNYKSDYWRERARMQSKDGSLMELSSELLDKAGNPILRDLQVWKVNKNDVYYTLDLSWTGTALTDVTIGKYAYGGLFLRMPWKRGTPASCLNSEGDKNQAGEGKSAKWVDLAMKIDGMEKMAHIAIIDHPKNSGYPTLWRIDGQFGIGPALARRGDIKIPRGESLTYRYRLVVYEGEFNGKLIEEESKSFGLLTQKP